MKSDQQRRHIVTREVYLPETQQKKKERKKKTTEQSFRLVLIITLYEVIL